MTGALFKITKRIGTILSRYIINIKSQNDRKVSCNV